MFFEDKLKEFGAIKSEEGIFLPKSVCLVSLLEYDNTIFPMYESEFKAVSRFLVELEREFGLCDASRHRKSLIEEAEEINCHQCKNQGMIPKQEDQVEELYGIKFIIPKVPFIQCGHCGNIYYGPDALELMDRERDQIKQQLRTGKYEIKDNVDKIELSSVKRLVFEPQGWEQLMRDQLRSSVATMFLCEEEAEVLYMLYESNDHDRFDLENVLTYNVGAGAFKNKHPRRAVMERSFMPPETSWSGVDFPIRQVYDSIMPEKKIWAHEETVSFWETVLNPLKGDIKPAQIWNAIRQGYIKTSTFPTENALLGLQLKLQVPDPARFQLFSVLKSLLDGVMSAFHCHNGAQLEEVGERIGYSLKLSASDIQKQLMDPSLAVLGSRSLVQPYRAGVYWNPADDRLVHIDIAVKQGEKWFCSGELFTVVKDTVIAELLPNGGNGDRGVES